MAHSYEIKRPKGYGCAPHCNMKIISRTEAGVSMNYKNYKVTKGLKKTRQQKAAAKRNSASIGSDADSLHACDDRDDDEDELEVIEDGLFIEDGSFIEDASFIADDSSVATKDSLVEYAVNRFTKTCQEFTKAIDTFEESAVIKCKETADVIVDAANWKFPKATSYTTATNVTGATDVTGCIIYPVVTEASDCTEISVVTDASVYAGLTGPEYDEFVDLIKATSYTTATNVTGATDVTGCIIYPVVTEEHPAVEVSYNSQAVTCRTLEPQVQKKDEAFSTPLLSRTRDTEDVFLFTSVPERMAHYGLPTL